jgi:hypothetical protein
MRFVNCRMVTLLVLMTSTGLATVTLAHEIGGEALVSPAIEDVDSTGSIGRPESTLRLSDEQRGFVFLGVTSLPDVPVIDGLAPHTATMLPASIKLQELPAMVVRRVPHVRDHVFVKFEDYILIVRSADRVVVAEIPRYRLVH